MNITASVFINDDEPGLHRDLEAWLEKLAPEKPYGQSRHNGYEDNADAHLKRSVMGLSLIHISRASQRTFPRAEALWRKIPGLPRPRGVTAAYPDTREDSCLSTVFV